MRSKVRGGGVISKRFFFFQLFSAQPRWTIFFFTMDGGMKDRLLWYISPSKFFLFFNQNFFKKKLIYFSSSWFSEAKSCP